MGIRVQLATPPLEIERNKLEGRELAFSELFAATRRSSVWAGGWDEGVGADVV